MEDLWKDMSLSSTPVALQSYHIRSPAAAPFRAAAYRQDYLAVPAPLPQPPCLPRGAPYPALTLSPSLEFTFLSGGSGPPSNSSSGEAEDYPFGLSTASGANSNNSNGKRVQVDAPAAAGDRRQRRMVKNRESAARSRARKQAYTNELELELAQLRRENQMLIKRQQDFINDRSATAAQAVLPDCSSSSSGSSRSRSSTSTLHLQLEQQQRCSSAPLP